VVAVLGSDVYDKLLILRALRDQLPGAVWITTDLDANLLHPEEFRYARNLIVGSTYDLVPSSTLHSSTPPFRDSYQTSAWVATRLAVDSAFAAAHLPQPPSAEDAARKQQQAFSESIPPLLFEVGRNGVVRLRQEGENDSRRQAGEDTTAPCLTCEPKRDLRAYALGALLLSVLAIATVHQTRPHSGAVVVTLSGVVVVVALLATLAWSDAPGGEPLSITAGVSIWPSIGIRVLTIFLTMDLIRRVLRRLEWNAEELGRRFFHQAPVERSLGPDLRELWKRIELRELAKRIRDREVWTRLCRRVQPPAWLGGSLILFTFLVIDMSVVRRLRLPTYNLLLVQSAFFLAAIAVWWAFIFKRTPFKRFNVQVRSVNGWLGHKQETTATELWLDYRNIGTNPNRIMRAAAIGLLYFAFGSTVFGLLGGAGSPGRGRLVPVLDGLTIGIGVLLMIFLLFLVVDAIRLCIGWIHKLMDEDLEWKPESIDGPAKVLDLPPKHAECWVRVNLIGERTAEVGRLVYYPLIVILLMLLARSTYFDGFAFPLALSIVVGLNFTIVLVAAALLNAVARDARDTCIKRLREVSAATKEAETPLPAAATPKALEDLVKELKKIDVGAFQRIPNQPLVRAAILLLTGLGMTWGEYSVLLW
jgi:hypothetical protein